MAESDDPLSAAIQRVTGTHCIGDLFDCECDSSRLQDVVLGEKFLLDQIRSAGFSILKYAFHQFDPMTEEGLGGYTGMIVLGESHLSNHTWPDEREVYLDLYTCNVSQDNSAQTVRAFINIINWFQPRSRSKRIIKRGKK